MGAALIAALTIKRVQEGNLAGIKNKEKYFGERNAVKDAAKEHHEEA